MRTLHSAGFYCVRLRCANRTYAGFENHSELGRDSWDSRFSMSGLITGKSSVAESHTAPKSTGRHDHRVSLVNDPLL